MPRNNKFHTAQYYTVAVAPLGMFDNYSTIVSGFDKLVGSWDSTTEQTIYTKETTINGHIDVFAGGMQDNGTSIQADNNNGFSKEMILDQVTELEQCFHKTKITSM